MEFQTTQFFSRQANEGYACPVNTVNVIIDINMSADRLNKKLGNFEKDPKWVCEFPKQ